MSDQPTDTFLPADAAPSDAPGKPAKKPTDWWAEIKGFAWLVLAVLAIWSFIAKPFYIPSESMMPTLIKGDQLVVTKFPYGWSFVSPTFHVLPFMHGRLLGRLPTRGDVVILTPPGGTEDYIKRVIGLPGDRLAVVHGQLVLNGKPVPKVAEPPAMIPIDANVPCDSPQVIDDQQTGADGKRYCVLPRFRETLPNGVSYDTIDLGQFPQVDEYPEIVIPPNKVFVMGDNRDQSADSRVPAEELGLGGPIPYENIGGRAEFISFSLKGSASLWNPLSWFGGLRSGRAGISLHPAKAATP